MTLQDAVFAPKADESAWGELEAAFVPRRPPEQKDTPDDHRFDVHDVEDAFACLNRMRMNPRYNACDSPYAFGGVVTSGGSCSYVDRVQATGEAKHLPSCLVGTILALLTPDFFHDIRMENVTVNALPGIELLFTPRAVKLLKDAQGYADGRIGEPQTWGDAFTNALIQLAP